MNATTTRKPRKVNRTCAVLACNGDAFLLEILQQFPRSQKADYYIVDPIPADFGTAAFRLEKEDGTAYSVLLDTEGGRHVCDCPGAHACKHVAACKHVLALLALHQAGRLPKPVILPLPKPAPQKPRPAAEADDGITAHLDGSCDADCRHCGEEYEAWSSEVDEGPWDDRDDAFRHAG